VSQKKIFSFAALCVVALVLLIAVLVPTLREKAQSLFSRNGHEILATAEGDVLNDGTNCKVIKFRSGEGIYVEILKVQPNGDTSVVDKILLPDKHDGLFNYQGHVTRLAIADIDNDGKLELLAPTFDAQLVPHLNVFQFNPLMKRFELFQPTK
jgi:hypothetical protein